MTSSTVLALAVILVLPLIAAVPELTPWLPSALVGAPAALLQGAEFGDFLRPALLAVLATGGALLLAVRGVGRREL